MHTLELGLLILESVLLLVTVLLLVKSIREGRGRDALIMQVERATRILTRHEYFLTVTDSMLEAKSEVIACITGRQPAGEDIKRVREIANCIERLTKAGVQVKYIMPKFHDRLYAGWLYSETGAEVRYSGSPLSLDFRYTVVDEDLAVIGIPKGAAEKEATKNGYRIPSDGLASILSRHFYECWQESISFEEHLRETIKQTGATPRLLARELGIDEKEVEKVAGQ